MADSSENLVTRRFSRRFQVYMVGEGALVGLAGGGVVALYRLSLSLAESGLRGVAAMVAGHPAYVVPWIVAGVAISLAVHALTTWEPDAQGSGIPQVDAEVIGRLDMSWPRVLLAKFAAGTLCALGGLSLGREGPSVQLGAMAGKGVSRVMGRGRGEERLLSTCGAAAGMSAAFHAPLTGVLFAIEEIHKEFSAPLIVSVMAAAITSDYLVSQVLGVAPVLSFVFQSDLPHADYLLVLLLGVLLGVAGALHNRGMFLAAKAFKGLVGSYRARLAIVFGLSAIVILVAPQLSCGGDAIVDLLEDEKALSIGLVAILLLGKYLFTTFCFSSDAPGGTLFPLCIMGALLGCLFGKVSVDLFGMSPDYVNNFIVLGIGGLFASVIRAPVTAVVLAFELTGSLDALLSVSLVSIVSYVTASLTRTDPFYEHLLAGLLMKGEPRQESRQQEGKGEKTLRTLVVGADSPADGKTISQVPWPATVRVVLVIRAGEDIVPTGDLQLEALDELLLMMDVDVEEGALEGLQEELGSALANSWEPKSSRLRKTLRGLKNSNFT